MEALLRLVRRQRWLRALLLRSPTRTLVLGCVCAASYVFGRSTLASTGCAALACVLLVFARWLADPERHGVHALLASAEDTLAVVSSMVARDDRRALATLARALWFADTTFARVPPLLVRAARVDAAEASVDAGAFLRQRCPTTALVTALLSLPQCAGGGGGGGDDDDDGDDDDASSSLSLVADTSSPHDVGSVGERGVRALLRVAAAADVAAEREGVGIEARAARACVALVDRLWQSRRRVEHVVPWPIVAAVRVFPRAGARRRHALTNLFFLRLLGPAIVDARATCMQHSAVALARLVNRLCAPATLAGVGAVDAAAFGSDAALAECRRRLDAFFDAVCAPPGDDDDDATALVDVDVDAATALGDDARDAWQTFHETTSGAPGVARWNAAAFEGARQLAGWDVLQYVIDHTHDPKLATIADKLGV